MESSALELVKDIYSGWERGDFSSNDWAHPEIELVVSGGPDPGSFSGLEEVAAGWRDFLRVWKDIKAVPDEYRDLGGDRVLVLLHNQGRGRTSGMDLAEVWQRSANLFEITDGKVRRLTIYWDADEALREAGAGREPPEPAGPP